MKPKNAQSEIVSSVLLILIVVTAVMVIMAFVVPFVKNKLKNDCYDINGVYSISDNPKYSCWNNTGKNLSIQIHLGDNNASISGFRVSLASSGESKTIDIKEGTVAGVSMYNGSQNILLPGKNSEKTYLLNNIITSKPEKVELYPILSSGKTCEPPETMNLIPDCG